MSTELWKDILGFPGYQISNFGRVRSFKDCNGNITTKEHLLTPSLNKDDYYYVDLYSSSHKPVHKRIHRLVADAFIGSHDDLVVNHINGDKHDNVPSNLEFVTAKENSTLASKNGLYKTKTVKNKETGEIFNSLKSCADKLNVHPSNISDAINGKQKTCRGFHFEYMEEQSKEKKFLYDFQYDAISRMSNGCILNGSTGSGKSRTGLYYYFKENGGNKMDGYTPMNDPPQDLYIITTAMKRDKMEWEEELNNYLMSSDTERNIYSNKIVVDSWQNIAKYKEIRGSFFIFDEDKVTGKGAWAKAFKKIAMFNNWIILSASPADTWQDYATVFIANGFFKNITEFNEQHVVFSPYTKYPMIQRYINEGRLIRLRNKILVDMDDCRKTVQIHEDIFCNFDNNLYKSITKNRWNIWEDRPIKNAAELCYSLRRVVNSDEDRQVNILELFEKHPKIIIFYSFDYELDILKNIVYGANVEVAEYNGHMHQPVPEGDSWVYLVNYTSGAEAWNCITTDTIIFFSQTYSYKTLLQATGRIDRLNTPYEQLYYYHLKSRSGIDLAISKALRNKKKFNEGKFARSY